MIDDYLKAKRLGDWAYRKAMLSGQYPYLIALDDLIRDDDVSAENRLGLVEIPLAAIAGTKTTGRQQAFANNFMPILNSKTEFAMKWISLYDAAAAEGIRDAILVYEYMGRFYVEEGNKRVSVSKFNGAESILANVIRILPKRTDEKANRIYYEFVDFYKVCSFYGIVFSEEGSYQKLAALLGRDLVHEWPEELRKNLIAGFARFQECFHEKGGDKLELTEGDAFLIYLNVYGLDALLYISTDEINDNLEKIWQEFLKTGNDVMLVEAPEEIKKETPFFSMFLPNQEAGKKQLEIAFIYEKNTGNSSWVYSHELGRNALEAKFPGQIHTFSYENRDTQEKITAAIDDAAEKHADIIFTTTGLMVDSSLKAAVRYPDIKIMNCSVNTSYNSIRTYYSRMYEAKFLMGALAASVTEGNDLGYAELCPLYGTVANINAFAIGAQIINPYARIHLQWSADKEYDWKEELRKAQIQTISGPEMIRPKMMSREFGVYIIADKDVVANVAMPVFDWGKYYELIVRSVMEGSYDDSRLAKSHQALNYWFGLAAGVVDVFLSGDLTYSSRKMIDILKKEIISGRLSPFDGEIHSQTGIVKPADAPRLSAEEIVDMRWLNDNVIGGIPPLSQFTDAAQELILASGFMK